MFYAICGKTGGHWLLCGEKEPKKHLNHSWSNSKTLRLLLYRLLGAVHQSFSFSGAPAGKAVYKAHCRHKHLVQKENQPINKENDDLLQE